MRQDGQRPSGGDVVKRTARQPGKTEKILLADVARAYYLGGKSKVEIAKDFSLSRFQIARMLEEARELGIVTIEIRDPRSYSSVREEQVAAALGIPRVRVIEVSPSEADTDGPVGDSGERIGIAIMDMLKEAIRPQMTVGISWSRTLDIAAKYLPELPPCDLVQLAGALQLPGSGRLPRMITQLGHSPGIHTWPIYAPLVVDEISTARDLIRQPEIAQALEMADRLDLAVVAIGGWGPGQSTVWEKVSAADRQAGKDAGAVAEISGRLLAEDGSAIHTALDQRTIGVRIDQLVKAPEVIAVARGVRRVDAVCAAVRAGIVTRLVIDSVLATEILNRQAQA